MQTEMYSRGHAYGVKHLLAPFSGPLEDVLEKALELNKESTQFLLDLGAIYLNQKRLAQSPALNLTEIKKDDYLRVHQTPRRFPVELFNYPICVIHEDEDLLIIDKPSGLPVHPTVDNTQENILALLEKARGEKLYITHRLDTGTSGLLIFARNALAQVKINQFLVDGEIRKYYRAFVSGHDLPEGEWLHFMEPSPRAPKKVSESQIRGWAECKLNIVDQTPFTHEKYGNVSEILIELLTGRTHQIRSQLGFEGFPIIGDKAYGSSIAISNHEQICLQACVLMMPALKPSQAPLSFKLNTRPWSQAPLSVFSV